MLTTIRRVIAAALVAGLMVAGLAATSLATSTTLSVTGEVAPTVELAVVDPTESLRADADGCTFVSGSITVRTNLHVSLEVAVDGMAPGDARLVMRTTAPAPGTACTDGTSLGITPVATGSGLEPTAGTTRPIWVAATTSGAIPHLVVTVVEDR